MTFTSTLILSFDLDKIYLKSIISDCGKNPQKIIHVLTLLMLNLSNGLVRLQFLDLSIIIFEISGYKLENEQPTAKSLGGKGLSYSVPAL